MEKKNFVYPPRLEMGFTLLYALDQESVAKHAEDRRKKQLQDLLQSETITQQEEIEPEEIEQSEQDNQKNILDSDDDQEEQQEQEQQSTQKTVKLTAEQLKGLTQQGSFVQDNNEVTIVEVNPNARRIQERNNQKQKEKEQPKQQQQQQQQKSNNKQQQSKQTKNEKQGKQQDKNKDKEEQNEEQNKANQNVRGKKNKLKKLKERYAEQSDEERELRMKLLGAKEMKGMPKVNKKKNDEDDDKKSTQYIKEDEKSLTEQFLLKQNIQMQQIPVQQQQEEQKKEDPKTKPELEPKQQDEEEEDKDQEKHSSDSEEEEIKEQEPNEDNVHQEVEYLEMQKLVSYLYDDDKYLALIPMCAPYIVIGQNKYKMKITPGTLKKGKAAKDLLNYFSSQKDVSNIDKKMIKMITDEEMVGNLLSGMKITAAGMLQLKLKEKQAKKLQHKKQTQQQS